MPQKKWPGRKKGPGTIKFLDTTKQDEVEMRRALWLGGTLALLQARLTDLYTEQSKLIQQRSDLGVRALPLLELLRRLTQRQSTALQEIKTERTARAQLRAIEIEFDRVETALGDNGRQIEETQKQIEKHPRSRQRKAVFSWQEKAVQLIMLHKLDPQPLSSLPDAPRALVKTKGMFPMPIVERERHPKIRTPKSAKEHSDQDRKQRAHARAVGEQEGKKKNETEDKVLSTQGATITTDELQKQLRGAGFSVGSRELRRYMRVCGVAGQQGRRTDTTSDNSKG